MGMLVNGKWQVEVVNPKTKDGEYQRQVQHFRKRIDGKEFPLEKDRYHLYISYACPWAHRILIARELLGLEDYLSFDIVSPLMFENGWSFDKDSGSTGDSHNSVDFLKDIYTIADPNFTGRVTVPILWDKKQRTIVNNESSEILRILNEDFRSIAKSSIDLYPEQLRKEIDLINEDIYHNINNGVYKVGFATTQEAYDKNFDSLFLALSRIEKHLEQKNFLVGDQLTEADVRLFTTLIRFDSVYIVHFKCNKFAIRETKNLKRYLKDLWQRDAFKNTTNFDHIKRHYYLSHTHLNPSGLIPNGPDLPF